MFCCSFHVFRCRRRHGDQTPVKAHDIELSMRNAERRKKERLQWEEDEKERKKEDERRAMEEMRLKDEEKRREKERIR